MTVDVCPFHGEEPSPCKEPAGVLGGAGGYVIWLDFV